MILSFLAKRLIPIFSSSAILLIFTTPAHSNPFYNQDLRRFNIYSNIYEKAEKELDQDYNTLYRIAERISRANQLNDFTWRIRILPRYDINAYALENNLLGINRGLLDQFKGDTSAISCAVAHEMAHHVKKHKAVEDSIYLQWANTLDLNARNKAIIIDIMRKGLLEKLEKEIKKPKIISNLLKSFGFDSVNNISRILIDKINSSAKKRLRTRLSELRITQEFEADKIAYEFSVRAGFEEEGCLRLMEIFSRQNGAQLDHDADHPSLNKRIAKLKEYVLEYNIQSLKNEGNRNIVNTSALSYEYNRNEKWLIIYSRFGSPQDDIKRLFPSN